MRVYLAAPYAARETIKGYAEELTRIGFTVTASWLDEQHDINPTTTGAATSLTDEQASAHARTDLRDIGRSDLFVLFTESVLGVDGSSGGRHVETGYAIARNLPVIVVGEPENIFHRLAKVIVRVPDWHEAVVELSHRLVDHRSNQLHEDDRAAAEVHS